jgi:uncharacterized protein YfaS (alpha-2-macroglobulin family)
MPAQPRSRLVTVVRLTALVGAFAVLPILALLINEPAPAEAATVLSAEAAAVHKTKDNKFWVAVSLTNSGEGKLHGILHVELIDKDGKALSTTDKDIDQADKTASYQFEFPAEGRDTEGLKLRYSFGKEKFETELANILLAKAHETAIVTSPEFYSGSSAAFRCEVHGVKSVVETVPLPGSSVEVKLQGKDGKQYDLYKGKTGDDGLARADMKLPKLPTGDYKLVVATRSSLGDETRELNVKVKGEPKVLLVTDKPLYQPGQAIHIRALCLRPFDLTPVDAVPLTFEVEDPKGNKVFKRSLSTSEFGVASADFQLADEINMGSYQVRAQVGEQQSNKTVEVKKYVLPKFKTDVTADKKFYLPKETIAVDLQTDYFFGKPVANSKVKVTASTFDVQFKDFQTVDTKTDANGHAKAEIKLPDYFVGQPLQKGDALVKLEVKITDTADHTETVTRTYPVAEQSIKVSLIPEGGRLMPGVENRVFAAAIYPDGSPAAGCEIKFWKGREAKGKPHTAVKTSDSGLAEWKFTPRKEDFHQGAWGPRNVEVAGGVAPQAWGPQNLLDVAVEARDAKGNTAKAATELNSEPLGENVLLRLDKAIYKGGDTMKVEILTSAGLPTTYLDVVKGGQTLLTRWLDVKDGKASYKLDLPTGVFGTLELHAYQQLASGEIIRDSRVVYVHSRDDLKIEAKADKDVYLPGDAGRIVFTVTDRDGKPTAAALGVIIVDEAVYALQEMQPGLEKVYFTLQEELLKPQAQVAPPMMGGPMPFPGRPFGGPIGGPAPPPVAGGLPAPAAFKPGVGIDTLVRDGDIPEDKQQIAEVLLTAVKPKAPARLNVDPAFERKQKFEGQARQVAWALFSYAVQGNDVLALDKKTKRWTFKDGLLDAMVKAGQLNKDVLTDPFGKKLALTDLARIEKDFTPDQLGKAITLSRMQQLGWGLVNVSTANQAKWFKDGKWDFPESVLRDAAKNQGNEKLLKDAWGNTIKLVKSEKKLENPMGWNQLDYHEMVSAGPDEKIDTADDVKSSGKDQWHLAQGQWFLPGEDFDKAEQAAGERRFNFAKQADGMPFARGGFGGGLGGGFGGGPPGMPVPMAAAGEVGGAGHGGPNVAPKFDKPADGPAKPGESGAAAPTRLREYFPETLLWQPALITDDKGRAELPLNFADSITTWRLSASASSKGGALGGMTAPLRVFQDFFVDLDMPVALTQNDEVAFPVAVYNYLKTSQTVKLELQSEPWFELMDGGNVRSLDLKPNEVVGVKFRIKAKKAGQQPLTVKASGSKTSDAIKRSIEVVPDGKKVEQVISDKLTGKVKQTLTIPEDSVPDSSKLIVKLYPGVFSQVLEGTEGMLRMPGGCMEQTSSSAYPNVLVVDYVKKSRTASPQLLLKSEQYLNVGYQRLLTFERPGGGFDWWGSGPPLVWLSAYGLQEFNDMAKVYPIDRGVIVRTQKWLMDQQNAAEGTWDKIGATHSVTIEHMGDAKLLLTSYVAWSLLDSGMRSPQLEKSIKYVREHIADAKDNPYVLALAANALAAWDANDDSTLAVLKKLEGLKKEKPELKAVCFPCGDGVSLSYAHGDSVTVETTALTALAMLKTKQFTTSANKALMYLVKSKDGSGTWGSTQATILSLKALVAGLGGTKQEGKAEFVITVNGKEAAKGEVTEENADVMRLFDLKEFTKVGDNEVEIAVKGDTSMMYQIVGRHYSPWGNQKPVDRPVLDIGVEYDRTKLSTADVLKAKATLRYNGDLPTYQVIVDLGIPPGFTADPGDFAEIVAAKKAEKFSMTTRQVTLYLGDVKPGDVRVFEYSLKPKYPIKAKTPGTVAYEYYTPANRAAAKPVELTVEK